MAQNCSAPPLGQLPLDDLGPSLYQNRFQGGLYPGGSNIRPQEHTSIGVYLAHQIRVGNYPIYLVALGFSFTKQILAQLQILLAQDPGISPRLHLIDATLAGHGTDNLADPADEYWATHVPAVMAAAGVAPSAVQVTWVYSGLARQREPFPQHARTLTRYWYDALANAKSFFPNLRQAWISPIHYQGYENPPAEEPYAFEQGFAVKRLIERQIEDIDGTMTLNGVLPWLTWGGYPWTDGAVPRSDGLSLVCPEDVLNDGVHLSATGAMKLAQNVKNLWYQDPAATPWLLK